MRLGKELIGKPIYSMTDGRYLGTVKDLYVDLELDILNGIYLGSEGIFNRKIRVIPRPGISVLGLDTVLAKGPDVVTDSNELREVEIWLRREDLSGREINTPGGTKVATIGDVLFDEEAKIVGFSLARVFVEGPVAENRVVMNEAILDKGIESGNMTIDLAKAEQSPTQTTETAKVSPPEGPAEPPKSSEDSVGEE